VVGGSIDIAQNGYTPALSAAVQGADIVIIAASPTSCRSSWWVKTAITNAAELKGQPSRSAATAPRTDTAADFALAHLKPRATTSRSAARRRGDTDRGRDDRTSRRHDGAISTPRSWRGTASMCWST